MGHVTITLNNRTYRLRCGDGEEPRLLELAGHLRQRIESLSAEFGQVGDDRLLVMAALLATDELLDTKSLLADYSNMLRLGETLAAPPPLPIALPTAQTESGPQQPNAAPELTGAGPDSGQVADDPSAAQPRKPKHTPQRASLNDRLAEARDAAAAERRANGGT